ncbi:MAG: tRNA preQ1(34) S-adenosylmethionine ribosyltransferase-isomerase QueA [Candidatus Sericytochromatia bacterium]
MDNLLKSSYYYDLPETSIATKPVEPRHNSKLMIINRAETIIKDDYFFNLVNYLKKDDLIVLNDTRVIPARLFGKKNRTGADVEVFLVREIEKDTWLSLAKPAKRLKENTNVYFNDDLEGVIIKCLETGERIIKFKYTKEKSFMEILKDLGEVPFPPYIKSPECSSERYQTIYSKNEGSVAAPTAGLHFTNELIDNLKNKGVKFAYLTLHVGLGTFLPVKEEIITNHKMHEEFYELSKETADILNNQKITGNKIIAVGTTVTRVLETVYNKYNEFRPETSFSDIFIYPGYKFKSIDHLITNFHLPESTLLMLVSAFWEKNKILDTYNYAIQNNYRFYSFGDSMFLI